MWKTVKFNKKKKKNGSFLFRMHKLFKKVVDKSTKEIYFYSVLEYHNLVF